MSPDDHMPRICAPHVDAHALARWPCALWPWVKKRCGTMRWRLSLPRVIAT